MSNYLVASKLYNTGFIPFSAASLRIKQGLAPQDITNACAYVAPPAFAYPSQGIPSGAKCNQKNLYPAKQSEISYGIPSIPNSCPCLDYIKAP